MSSKNLCGQLAIIAVLGSCLPSASWPDESIQYTGVPSAESCKAGCRHISRMAGWDHFAYCEDFRPDGEDAPCWVRCVTSGFADRAPGSRPWTPACWLEHRSCKEIAVSCQP